MICPQFANWDVPGATYYLRCAIESADSPSKKLTHKRSYVLWPTARPTATSLGEFETNHKPVRPTRGDHVRLPV